jgi:hypothetical protein
MPPEQHAGENRQPENYEEKIGVGGGMERYSTGGCGSR